MIFPAHWFFRSNGARVLQRFSEHGSAGGSIPNLHGSIDAPGHEPCAIGAERYLNAHRPTVIDPKQREAICIPAAEENRAQKIICGGSILWPERKRASHQPQ